MNIAVVGATGLVGTKMLEILAERNFPISNLLPVASPASVGKKISFKQKEYTLLSVEQALAAKPQIAIFSAGGSASLELAPLFAAQQCYVIDNSSAWRMNPEVPLVVPEVNAHSINQNHYIIANPNCSTIQMVVALQPLHQQYTIQRIVVSTYQSVTGTGVKAVEQLMGERAGNTNVAKAYAHAIDLNVLPHIDTFMPNGYTKEELKMTNETKKILADPNIALTATCVRIPTMGGHSEAVNIQFANAYELPDVINILQQTPGIVVQNNVEQNQYPMPLTAHNTDAVYVGRIRRDDTISNGLNLWIVSDNLRKGAATNAIQIAEYLIKQNWF